MVGTVGIALGSGYFMENSAPTVSRNVKPAPIQVAAIPAPHVALDQVELTASPLPEIPADIFQELNMPQRDVIPAAISEAEIVIPETVPAQGGFACEIDMSAEATIAALVNIDIKAACLPDTRVTLHHNGLMVSEMTDDRGELFLTIPALAETAVFMADLGDGKIANVTVKVPSLEFYDRALVQWQGDAGIHLHAMEFGAAFGEEGHVWDQQTGSLEKTIRGQGGFLTQMGNPDITESLQAQVYTYPSGTSARAGDIVLEIEAEVTQANCGRDISAQSMQISEAGQPRVQDLALSMPDCDAVGDFLVLKNVLEDLKVASK
ncbi:MAG: hypothetical protein CML60_00690 [Rhodobacteraceae bacterium]|nr:hypothetical protein [Paracoccaceae bacterium]MBT24908.1 hypothetical protein [Paracoccaceae bacterium]